MSNEFLPFGTGAGANVMAQATYSALGDRTQGFQTGEADSSAANKAWRQAAYIAHMIGSVIDTSGRNALDDANLTTLRTNFLNALADLVPFRLPAGIILTSAHASAPTTRSVFCNGSVVSRTGTYADLFAAIGTTFNTGGEAGTDFRLPDLRGVVVRGQDAGRGFDPSRVFGSYQADQNKAHTHLMTYAAFSEASGGTTNHNGFVVGDQDLLIDASYDNAGVVQSDGGTEARMKNIALQFYITY